GVHDRRLIALGVTGVDAADRGDRGGMTALPGGGGSGVVGGERSRAAFLAEDAVDAVRLPPQGALDRCAREAAGDVLAVADGAERLDGQAAGPGDFAQREAELL